MAYTQTQLDALDAALATGVLTVRHGETQTTYRSLDEMRAIRDLIRSELAGGFKRRTVAKFSKGV